MNDSSFVQRVLNIHSNVYSAVSEVTWLVPRETAAVSVHVLCTPCNHVECHFIGSHIRRAVTCHLHFWQNECTGIFFTCYFGNTEVTYYIQYTPRIQIVPEGRSLQPGLAYSVLPCTDFRNLRPYFDRFGVPLLLGSGPSVLPHCTCIHVAWP